MFHHSRDGDFLKSVHSGRTSLSPDSQSPGSSGKVRTLGYSRTTPSSLSSVLLVDWVLHVLKGFVRRESSATSLAHTHTPFPGHIHCGVSTAPRGRLTVPTGPGRISGKIEGTGSVRCHPEHPVVPSTYSDSPCTSPLVFTQSFPPEGPPPQGPSPSYLPPPLSCLSRSYFPGAHRTPRLLLPLCLLIHRTIPLRSNFRRTHDLSQT